MAWPLWGAWFVVVLLGATGAAVAQTNQDAAKARAATEAALADLARSAQLRSLAQAGPVLQAAVEQFKVAIQLDPANCLAHHGWALAVVGLANRTTDQAEFRRLMQQARERFAAAGACPGADPQVFDDWATLLQTRLDLLAQSEYARFSILSEARQALETGLNRARSTAEQAKFEGLLGQCLVRLVMYSRQPAERQALFDEANRRFEAAVRAGAASQNAALYAGWGLALLKLGQERADPAILRHAVQRMEEGLRLTTGDKDPAALALHYNLACTQAALGDALRALAHLRTCFANDPTGRYIQSAWVDPDLTSLKHNPEFVALVRPQGAPPPAPPRATPDERAQEFFRAGNELFNQAVAATNEAARATLLDQAIDNYRAATVLQPEFNQPYLLWANCLMEKERLAANKTEWLKRTRQTRERFAAAAAVRTADVTLFETWANYLTGRANELGATPAEKLAILTEAVGIYEKGLERARFSGEAAQLRLQLGLCLISLGDQEADRLRKRDYYARAVAAYAQTAQMEAHTKSGRLNGLWGVALLKLGRTTMNSTLYREAIQRLTVALEAEPENPDHDYNLACAHALLGNSTKAMRHLRTCFEKDPLGTYYRSVELDPDFDPIRTSDSYLEVFQPAPPVDELTVPRL